MLILSLNELKLIAKSRGIKGYKTMSKERLLSALNESVKEGERNDNARIKKIRERFSELRDRFSRPKIKEIRRNIYQIENKKCFSTVRMKEIEKNLLGLKNNLFELK